ncbi:MAG: hypothetical protein FOGNACKC_01993 [Anaerolineae bacterium]|nr:hypothetical protein [Anaerolineae bacterium]
MITINEPKYNISKVHCSKCNTLNTSDSKYCRGCGSSLSALLQKTCNCPVCNREILTDSKFCQYCAAPLTSANDDNPRLNEKGKAQNASVRNEPDARTLSTESRTELIKKLDDLENLVAKQKTDLKELQRKQAEYRPKFGGGVLLVGGTLLYGLVFGSPFATLIGLGMVVLMVVSWIIWAFVTNHYDEKVKKAEAELIQTQAEIKKFQSRLFSGAQ